MASFKLYHENSELVVQCKELQNVIKICSVRNRVFLLGSEKGFVFW